MKTQPSGNSLRDLPAHPLVSIIVPSLNQGRFIRDAIESCLSQDYRPIEVLVIDGGSTDETLDVLRSFDRAPEVRWVSEPDSGVVDAVNKGFARAQGDVGAIQSADDLYLPDAIRLAVEALCADRRLGLVFGDIVKVDKDGADLRCDTLPPFSVEAVLSKVVWIPQPSCFFRMDAARTAGGWREEVPYAADADLWLRILLRAEARKLDAFMARRRMHPDQRDSQGERIVRDYTRAIDDWFTVFGAPAALRPAADVGVERLKARYGAAGSRTERELADRFPMLPRLDGHVEACPASLLQRAIRRCRRALGTRSRS